MASFVVCPLDVVKMRLQNQEGASGPYRGTLGTLRTILREEGFRGWYRGLFPTVIGYLPTWSIYFTCYHQAKGFFIPLFCKQSSALCRAKT